MSPATGGAALLLARCGIRGARGGYKAGSRKDRPACRRDAASRRAVFLHYRSRPFSLCCGNAVPGLPVGALTTAVQQAARRVKRCNRLFCGKLFVNRLRNPLTGTAATRVIERALHTKKPSYIIRWATIIHIIAAPKNRRLGAGIKQQKQN